MDASEQQARLRLWRVPGIGPKSYHGLLSHFGSAQDALNQERETLAQTGLRKAVVSAIQQASQTTHDDAVAGDLDWSRQGDCHILFHDQDHYPQALKGIDDPPPLLFAQGDLDSLRFPKLAIVGSRHPSAGGQRSAQDFAHALAARGLCIVSGLAAGIDSAAHQGALDARGLTIAVLAHGLDRIYPTRNQALADAIRGQGLLLSEYPIGVAPHAKHFPRRNRLIAGLSLGTLVVEAAQRSGSLITARLAGEQGREIFAIPGSIHNPLARGCHELIRRGAHLVEQANDILEQLGPAIGESTLSPASSDRHQQSGNAPTATQSLDSDYQALLEQMGYDPITVDELIERSKLSADAVASMLLMLELQGLIGSVTGGRYQRLSAD